MANRDYSADSAVVSLPKSHLLPHIASDAIVTDCMPAGGRGSAPAGNASPVTKSSFA
jgi:hypothetical protein